MWHVEWIPLSFGVLMALIDVFMLGLIKSISLNVPKYVTWMIAPTIIYALQPWLFLKSLEYESLIVMNLIWDLASDLFVTLLGFFYFGERVGYYKRIGVFLSFVSLILLASGNGD